MNRRFALALVVGATPSALGQSTTAGSIVTYSLSWEDTGNHNGLLDPGESAVITMGVSFTNQNTVATFTPQIGTFGSGTIRGYSSGFVDIQVTGMNGSWNVDPFEGYGVLPDWDITGGQGNGQQVGPDLHNLQMGQFPDPPAAVNTTNPIAAIWSGLWTPATYIPAQITFRVAPGSASGGFHSAAVFRLNGFTATAVFTNASFGSSSIPLPAPSALAFAAAAPLLHRRR